MNRRTSSASNFFKTFFMNLLLQFEWLLLALILLVLHFWLRIPVVLFWAVLGVWGLLSMVVTWFVVWAVGCGEANPGAGAKRASERLAAPAAYDAPVEPTVAAAEPIPVRSATR